MLQLSSEALSPGSEEALGPAGVERTWRLDLVSGLLGAGTLAIMEMGPALAKKGYDASDLEVALLTSGQSLGLILSFFTAHLAARRPRVALVFRCELAANLFLLPVFFVRPSFALAFVVLHVLSRVCLSMGVPARVVVYRANFPTSVRGRLVARIRQLQLFLTTCFALLLSLLLDWNLGAGELVALFGRSPVAGEHMLQYAVPGAAALGLLGSLVYRRIREAPEEAGPEPAALPRSPFGTFREFRKVWKEDRRFRRYESFFFLFGFANIMAIPLTQIHAVEVLHASYLDLAMINVILVQGVMALTMVWWGRLVDRHPPSVLRGILNLIFALDFLALFLAPTIGWVYLGRIFRGISLGGGTLIWMLGPLYFARSPRQAAVYTGIHSVLTGVRWGVAPFAGVVLKEWCGNNSRPVFLIGFIVLLITGAAMLLESRRGERES
jgi:hypothetical protein